MFKELRNRSPDIKDLFSHQADILREYQKSHIDSPDVSLEIPTGSGKTLVGLLIAEYRRRFLNERVLYLSPTRQLAHQVGKRAVEYGIDARVFVGSKRTYNRKDELDYRSAKTIAISPYSGLFNVKPGLNDPQTIILDDAHGAETYIAGMWSVRIDRAEKPLLYSKVLELFEKDLPAPFVADMRQASRPNNFHKTEMIPFNIYHRNLQLLREILGEHIPNPEQSDLYFSWTTIREGLHACNLFISWTGILIRPYIPPTRTHQPFAQARHRVYMSATLGQGGELERITGIRAISRIETPKTFTQHGVGRRLFIFPDMIKEPGEYAPWMGRKVSNSKRTLGLCPTSWQAEEFRKIVRGVDSTVTILGANDIEDSLERFSKSEHALLLLTNRYDGIDLPNEDCRLLVLYGLPSKTNLQETFLEDRLRLEVLLRERIKTRIVQATGRCTRSDIDYAVVIMSGKALLNFCVRRENQETFHPAIQAEIRFALSQNVSEFSTYDDMMEAFMKKDENWDVAEQNIAEMRSSIQTPESPATKILSSTVKSEVDFWYDFWNGDFEQAVKHGREVVDSLSGPQLSTYSALWYYFISSASFAASQRHEEYRPMIMDFLQRAAAAGKAVPWFTYVLRSMDSGSRIAPIVSELQASAAESIEAVLLELGPVGGRFNEKMNEIESMLNSTDFKRFDPGLVELGRLLGFEAWKPEGRAAPDCVWQLGADLAVIFEAKAEESSEGEISVDECRQTSGHIKWARNEDRLKGSRSIICVLVTARSKIAKDALPHANELYLWPVEEARQLFKQVKLLLADARSVMISTPTEQLRERILERSIAMDITPESIQRLIMTRLLSELPVDG